MKVTNMRKMKLSEAIREGAMVTLFLGGRFCLLDLSNRDVFACALGAAYVGIAGKRKTITRCYLDKEHKMMATLGNVFPELDTLAPMPQNSEERNTLKWIIETANDEWGWSRERIAEWVEQLGY